MMMRSRRSARSAHHLGLAALVAASSLAAALACSSDDEGDGGGEAQEQAPLEGVEDDADDAPAAIDDEPEPPAAIPGGPQPNGLELPDDFRDWRVIGVAQRDDNDTIRVIVGNDIAVEAARAGETNPWPEGSMIGHYVWAQDEIDVSPQTIVPGDAFGAFTLMVKDSREYAADGGWAYGLWSGADLLPQTDPNFDRACVNCHTDVVADNDYVFTIPGQLPSAEAIANAGQAPNRLKLQREILDWRVLGVATRNDNDSIRVIVGNDVAVDAARAGRTNPWPDNSAIAHFVWSQGTNPTSPDTVVPDAFGAITFMVRNEDLFAADGGWAYSVWSGPDLAPPTDPAFDRACVNCHTDVVADNDYVFTRPGPLPR